MKIYTRTGDSGSTGLVGGARVDKDSLRIEAYGTIDELNSCLGVAAGFNVDPRIGAVIQRLQNELFIVGSDLATPLDQQSAAASGVPRIGAKQTAALEFEIDEFTSEIGPLAHFILPGGSNCGAALHLARCVCRRAERTITALTREIPLNPHVMPYINRLSDHLFELARLSNYRSGQPEIIWSRESVSSSTNNQEQ